MHWKIENSKMSNYFFCLLLSWKKLKKLEINFSDSLRMYAVTKYYFINIFQNYWFVEWRTQLYEMNELCENAYEYMNRDSQSKSNTKLIKSKKRSNIASFNVRGLVKQLEQANLFKDMAKYKVDICCLQETKVSVHQDYTLEAIG